MKILLYLFFIFLLFTGCKDDGPTKDDLALKEIIENRKIAEEIVSLVNAHRFSLGLSELNGCEICDKEAVKHSENMAIGSIAFGHDGFDYRFETIRSENNAISGAENVASGYLTSDKVMEGWLNSNGHKFNIEGDYTHIGVGIASDSDGALFFTQIFVKIP